MNSELICVNLRRNSHHVRFNKWFVGVEGSLYTVMAALNIHRDKSMNFGPTCSTYVAQGDFKRFQTERYTMTISLHQGGSNE